jgi:hypothetical protein
MAHDRADLADGEALELGAAAARQEIKPYKWVHSDEEW